MNKTMIKRKRLDARSFREWHMKKFKKHKGFSGSSPEQRNMMSTVQSDKLEGSSSGKENDMSDNVHSQQPREESGSKSQPENGEETAEQYDRVPNGYVQSSSSKDMHLNGKTHVEAMKDEAISKHVPSNDPDKTLSFTESESVGKSKEDMEDGSKFKGTPKELKSKQGIAEYWVPVGFSYLQLEKYCETLIKHQLELCAKTKKGVLNLQDVLIKCRECCDHPYLVDSSLEKFVHEGRPEVDILTAGIEASGKLLLLDKFLQEVKGKGQKVVILFQPNHPKSGVLELRYLLDDFICRRFGAESYVHIYRNFDRSEKRTACDLLNDKQTGRFVMLMEKCSSQSNIKLSSVDYVILFNSDWCPSNDIKCLRKMSIRSTTNHLKVLRLYTLNSVEEKVLTLAKKGSSLESNIQNFSHNMNHMLLLEGATYLLDKLDDFHGHCTSIANLTCLSEDRVLLEVFDELSALLSCQDGNECSFSLISKVPQGNGQYLPGISLHGGQDAPAMDDDIPPWAIWSSLLEERSPQWRLLPRSSEEIRRRGELSARLTHYGESGDENELATNKKTSSQDELMCQKSKSKKVFKPVPEKKSRKIAGHPTPDDGGKKTSSCREDNETTDVGIVQAGIISISGHITTSEGAKKLVYTHNEEETYIQRMKPLLLKQKEEIRDFYRAKKEQRAKLEEEHQLELNLINEGCKEAGAKEEELKRLEYNYQIKVEKHNREMDIRRKELEDNQRASRLKENSSQVNESPLDFNSGLAGSSENETCNLNDCEISCDRSREDTEILSFDSDEENDIVSMPAEAVSNTINNTGSLHLPPNEAPLSENLVGKSPSSEIERNSSTNIEPHPETLQGPTVENQSSRDIGLGCPVSGPSSSEIEGNSSTNIEPHTQTLQGPTVENQSSRNVGLECPVSGPSESDGENDVTMLSTGEALDHGSNLCTSKEPQLRNTHLDGNSTMEASGRASGGEIHCRLDEELSIFDTLHRGDDQQQTRLPSPSVTGINPVLQQSQLGMAGDGSLPLEQPDVSACLPSNQITWNGESSVVYDSQTSEIHSSCQLPQNQLPQNQLPLTNLACSLPSSRLPMQSFVVRDQTNALNALNASYTTSMQSPNSHFQNVFPSNDPLQNELSRMKHEEEEDKKIHIEKKMHLKSACGKEIEEIRKKYELLHHNADFELLQKNVRRETFRRKVEANKLLAETLNYYHDKSQTHLDSQEAVMAILELPLHQQYNGTAQTTPSASVGTTAAQTQVVHQLSDLVSLEPVRLQNAFPSPSYSILSPPTPHPACAPAPHLRGPSPSFGVAARLPLQIPSQNTMEAIILNHNQYYGSRPPSMSGFTFVTGRPNQVTPVQQRSLSGNCWTHPYLSNQVPTYPDGSPLNPVVL